MMKSLAILLMMSFVVLLLSGCNDEQLTTEPVLHEEVVSDDSEHLEEVEEVVETPSPEPSPKPVCIAETQETPDFIEIP